MTREGIGPDLVQLFRPFERDHKVFLGVQQRMACLVSGRESLAVYILAVVDQHGWTSRRMFYIETRNVGVLQLPPKDMDAKLSKVGEDIQRNLGRLVSELPA
jgi:hypothetical protein